MTREEAIKIINNMANYKPWEVEALYMAIKALEQQPRDCKTCAHSDNGDCAGTEECHECMWESKYEQQPCNDCISRADILDAIETWDKFGINAEQKLIRWQDHYVPYVHLDDVRNAIANMPSVTPQPKTGEWIVIRKEYEFMGSVVNEAQGCKCSNCDGIVKLKSDFCPNCGAKMGEVEE